MGRIIDEGAWRTIANKKRYTEERKVIAYRTKRGAHRQVEITVQEYWAGGGYWKTTYMIHQKPWVMRSPFASDMFKGHGPKLRRKAKSLGTKAAKKHIREH